MGAPVLSAVRRFEPSIACTLHLVPCSLAGRAHRSGFETTHPRRCCDNRCRRGVGRASHVAELARRDDTRCAGGAAAARTGWFYDRPCDRRHLKTLGRVEESIVRELHASDVARKPRRWIVTRSGHASLYARACAALSLDPTRDPSERVIAGPRPTSARSNRGCMLKHDAR